LTTAQSSPVSGLMLSPLALRSPEANTRAAPVCRSICQIAARPFSASSPFSAMLEFEPTEA